MNELYAAYKGRDDVRFLIVYTKEAHARQPLGPNYNFWNIGQPKSYQQRADYAQTCRKQHGIDITILVDTMNNDVQKAYGGLPNSMFIIDPRGNISAHKSWNDPLFVELSLRERVDNPPQVKHAGTMGSCEECHAEAVASIAREHPMTDCSVCHSYFFNRNVLAKTTDNAKKHAEDPDKPIDKEITCAVLCHNQEYLPPEHEVTGLPFSHLRHLNRGFACINCHGTNKHAFHDMSEKICLNCHPEPGSTKVRAGVEYKSK
jgi:hypothetical protein